jgi:hypothetical protein
MLRMLQIALTSFAVLNLRQRLQSSALTIMIVASGLAIGIVGAGFCLASIWIYLAQQYGSIAAGLWLGGGLILFAMLLTALMMSVHRRNARYDHPAPSVHMRELAELGLQ